MVNVDDVGEDQVSKILPLETSYYAFLLTSCFQVNVGIPDGKFSIRRLLKYVGPGYLVAIAYIDPGNCNY